MSAHAVPLNSSKMGISSAHVFLYFLENNCFEHETNLPTG